MSVSDVNECVCSEGVNVSGCSFIPRSVVNLPSSLTTFSNSFVYSICSSNKSDDSLFLGSLSLLIHQSYILIF